MVDYLTITDASAALRAGEVSATELVETAIAKADALDDRLGVFLSRYNDSARAAAAEADTKIAEGAPLGLLEGIPLGIKDIIAESQGPTTAQSLVLDPAWGEGIGDAVLVERLKSAGGITMGKLTTMEFAVGAPDPAKPFPIPRCTWDEDRWAGGSSSGSGSGVAAELFLGAIGTDTAGSVRIPAAFNGVTGLKPTFGRVPKSGIVPLGYTLDHPGPLARSAADCALILQVIAGADASDPYSAEHPVDDYSASLTGDLTGLRVGVDDLDRFAVAGIDPEQPRLFREAIAVLEAAGATIVPIEVPRYTESSAIDVVAMIAEAFAYHRSDLQERWNDYGQATRLIISAGDVVSGADYIQAQRVRRVAQRELAATFNDVELIVTPTGHLDAPLLAEMSTLNPLGVLASLHTPYWNPMGVPTLSVPIGLSSNAAPLAMSIAGPAWSEALVLRAGDAFQRRTAHHLDRAPILATALAT